jgi:glycosyltransferase involved in cell wall biosynthesis
MFLWVLAEKYTKGEISFNELSASFLDSFYSQNEYSSPKNLGTLSGETSFNGLFQWFVNAVAVSRSSLSTSLVFLFLLLRISLSAVSKFFAKLFVVYPSQYLIFFFRFKIKYYTLKKSKKKKNVLCIVPFMVVGGSEKVILNIAKGIDKDKFVFHLITTESGDNSWANEFENCFENVFSPSIKKFKSLYGYDTIYYKYFNFLIKKLDIDLVLVTQSATGYSYLARMKHDFKNLKVVDILHSSSWPLPRIREGSVPYVDARVCISKGLHDYLLERYREAGINNMYDRRVKTIYNGVDTKFYSPNLANKGSFKRKLSISEETKIISFVGRFSVEKNPLLFVEVANKISAKLLEKAKIMFVMAGGGAEFSKVERMISSLGLADSFVLTMMIDNVVELLNDSYVLLVVSKIEGIPLVALEAMSMKVPVLSTAVGGVGEVLDDGVNGFVISEENNAAESFTQKILDLIDGKFSYSEISEKARETIVERFSLESMISEYQTLLDELLSSS